jgi:hypothetical protein
MNAPEGSRVTGPVNDRYTERALAEECPGFLALPAHERMP